MTNNSEEHMKIITTVTYTIRSRRNEDILIEQQAKFVSRKNLTESQITKLIDCIEDSVDWSRAETCVLN